MNFLNNYSIKLLATIVLIAAMIQCTPKTGAKMEKEIPAPKGTDFQKPSNGNASFRAKAPEPGPAPIIKIGKSEQFNLDNGLKVILVENHKIPRISFRVLMDVEAWMEEDKTGLSELAGGLITRGTTNRTKAEIDEAVDFIGASLNASATSLSGSALTKHVDNYLEIFSDVLQNPAFPQEEFDKLVKQTASNLASSKDDPNTISSNVTSVINYGKDHPYGEIMTDESLANISLNDSKEFINKYWNPADAYLVMVGDLDMAKAKMLANKYFGNWKAKPLAKEKDFKQPAFPESTNVSFVNKTGAVQSVIKLTYPLDFPMGHPDRTAASVLNSILGGYFQSRINQNLRETNAFTYGARSTLSSDPLVGYFSAGASVRNEVTDSAIQELIYEVKRLRTELVSEEELQMVKNVLAGSFGRRLESPGTVASFALNKLRYKLADDYYDTYLERLSKVTREDVLNAAKKYLKPDKAHIIVVGSKQDVADKLVRFSNNGKIQYYNTNGDPIEMIEEKIDISTDQIIENYLNALGDRKALTNLNSVKSVMVTEMQGMSMEMSTITTNQGQFRMDMSMSGNIMQSQIYNKGKGANVSMGQKIPMSEEILTEFKYGVYPIPEMQYKQLGVTGKILDVEKLGDKKVIPVQWKAPEGRTWTEYYGKESGLKYKVVTQNEQNGEVSTQIVELKDYKPVDGILFSHQSVITAAGMPMPMKLEAKSIELNGEIDTEKFKVD